MPQALLPLIPDGATQVNTLVSIVREDGQWTYFVGVMPVFTHREEDRRSFRMFTAQLVCQGTCRVTEIVRNFGVSKQSVLRSEEVPKAGSRRLLRSAARPWSDRDDRQGDGDGPGTVATRFFSQRGRRGIGHQVRYAP